LGSVSVLTNSFSSTMAASTTPMKRILVTGGNTGIGLALCKQLATQGDRCHVYLGSRNAKRGQTAVDSILESSKTVLNVELVQIDIGDEASVKAAAEDVRKRLGSAKLFAVVNNAGTGLAHGSSAATMLNVNLMGTKRVCDAFIPLIGKEGRIVNVGSGAGPMWLGKQDNATKKLLQDPKLKWAELDAFVKKIPISSLEGFAGYGLSKAAVATFSMILAQEHPSILSSTITPGFIDTAICKGMGASKKPEEGTVSIHRCLFTKLDGNGYYYGSDGLRSPLDRGRNPGDPAFKG